MACEYRRIVTGHTPEGKSTVLCDSPVPLLEADSAAGTRQEDRAGAGAALIYLHTSGERHRTIANQVGKNARAALSKVKRSGTRMARKADEAS
jgi:hypothetical protein